MDVIHRTGCFRSEQVIDQRQDLHNETPCRRQVKYFMSMWVIERLCDKILAKSSLPFFNVFLSLSLSVTLWLNRSSLQSGCLFLSAKTNRN